MNNFVLIAKREEKDISETMFGFGEGKRKEERGGDNVLLRLTQMKMLNQNPFWNNGPSLTSDDNTPLSFFQVKKSKIFIIIWEVFIYKRFVILWEVIIYSLLLFIMAFNCGPK